MWWNFWKKKKITAYPKEESLYGPFKEGANLTQIPSNLTSDRFDFEKKEVFAVPVFVTLRALPEQKESRLKNVVLSHSSSDCSCRSSSDLSLSENKSDSENDNKSDFEQIFNKNESFDGDREKSKEPMGYIWSERRLRVWHADGKKCKPN